MSSKDIFNCQFQLWYPDFKTLTIESIILKIPEPCLNFLKSDGIIIPLGYSRADVVQSENEAQMVTWMKTIDRNIELLGSFVFPKLNWSSPKDAAWISPDKSLKCRNAEEVVLLLKSSDFIVHDLIYPYEDSSDKEDMNTFPISYYLILRRWKDFTSLSEFRCFVRNRHLTAISQRHMDTYIPSLDLKRNSILNDICRFYDKHIKGNFSANDYTFDIYRTDGEEIFLLDFNPYKASTDALLFTWEYLDKLLPVVNDSGNLLTEANIPTGGSVNISTESDLSANILDNQLTELNITKSKELTDNTINLSSKSIFSTINSIDLLPESSPSFSDSNDRYTESMLPAGNLGIEFRIVEKEDYRSGISATEFAWNAMPVDFYHLANGLDMNKFEDLMRLRELDCSDSGAED